MPKTAWPDATTDLTPRLTGLGVTAIPTGVTLADEITAAVERLEEVSGQSPFLVQDSAADYKLDPSRRTFLDLRSRWVEITSVTVDGETQTVDEDYWAKPYSGPYMSLEFSMAVISNGEAQTITVNGKRGYAANIPTEVWNAVLDYAAGRVYRTAAMAGTVKAGTVSEVKQDSVTLKFGGGSKGSGGDTASQLMSDAEAVFMKYARISLGGM